MFSLAGVPLSVKASKNVEELVLDSMDLYVFPDVQGMPKLSILSLRGNQIAFELPSSIAQLPSLRELYLGNNHGFSSLGDMSTMTSLERLNVEGTSMEALPDSIRFCSQMSHLSIRGARMTNLPDGLWSLSNLQYFDASHNAFTRIDSRILQLKSLRVLDASYNNFDMMPEQIAGLPLEQIHLEQVGLTSLPDAVGTLVNLTHLSVKGNLLESLPASLWTLPKLQDLDLAYNNIHTLNMETALPEVQALDLSFNNLSHVPEMMCNHSNLLSLNMESNSLSAVPDCIGDMESLNMISLSANFLSRFPRLPLSTVNALLSFNPIKEIDPSFCSLSNLLSLATNEWLVAELPNCFHNLSSLKSLFIKLENMISLPVSIGFTPQLSVITIMNTPLQSFPSEAFYTGASPLQELMMRQANISEIDEMIFMLPNLQKLDLSFNNIQNIKVASMSACQFFGGLNLKHVILGSNLLTEVVSPCFLGLENIASLDLSHNRLHGGFFVSSSHWNTLLTLSLSYNDRISVIDIAARDISARVITDVEAAGCVQLQSVSINILDPFFDIPLSIDLTDTGDVHRLGVEILDPENTVAVDEYPSQGISCHALVLSDPSESLSPNQKRKVIVHPEQYNFEHCVCTQFNYYFDLEKKRCLPSPREGVTVVYTRNISNPLMYVNKGYYPFVEDFLDVCKENITDDQCTFLKCQFPAICGVNAGPNSENPGFQCAEGYDTKSLLCSHCEENFFARGEACVACPKQAGLVLLGTTIILLIAFLICKFYLDMSCIMFHTWLSPCFCRFPSLSLSVFFHCIACVYSYPSLSSCFMVYVFRFMFICSIVCSFLSLSDSNPHKNRYLVLSQSRMEWSIRTRFVWYLCGLVPGDTRTVAEFEFLI